MRVEEAVTGAEGLWFVFAFTFLLYAALGAATVWVLRSMSRRWRESGEDELAGIPYGPPEPPGREGRAE